TVTLFDLVVNVDDRAARWSALRQNDKIDIPARAIRVGDLFRIIAQRFRRINRALFHLEQGTNPVLRRCFITGDGNLTDVVLRSLGHRDGDDHAPILALFADVFYLYVDVAVVLVELADAVQVLLQLDFV